MIHKVNIKKSEEKLTEEYWEMQAIRTCSQSDMIITNSDIHIGKGNLIVKTKEVENRPKLQEIAQFLSESGADAVTLVNNYRFVPDIPFV